MDSTYLEELIREVNVRGGGIVLTMAGKSEAVEQTEGNATSQGNFSVSPAVSCRL